MSMFKRKPKHDRLGVAVKRSDGAMPLERKAPLRMYLVPIHIGRRTQAGHVKARSARQAENRVRARLKERGLKGKVGQAVAKT